MINRVPVRIPMETSAFYNVFHSYCRELDLKIFKLLPIIQSFKNDEVKVLAHMDGEQICSFLLLSFETCKSGFFETRICFLRELWTRPEYRGQGLASSLIAQAEVYAHQMGVHVCILTARAHQNLYKYLGYSPCPCIQAANDLEVFTKYLM